MDIVSTHYKPLVSPENAVKAQMRSPPNLPPFFARVPNLRLANKLCIPSTIQVVPTDAPPSPPPPADSSPPRVRMYILFYNNNLLKQFGYLYKKYPWAHPIIIKKQDKTFENAFWKQLLEVKTEWSSLEMVGTLSWNSYKKVNLKVVNDIITNRSAWIKSEYYHFMETNGPVTQSGHPHLLQILQDVCKTLEVRVGTTAHCNYFMCSPPKMESFINWFEQKAKPVVFAHPLSMTNSNYNGARNPRELKALCGVPYYPHAPFVFERLNKFFFDKLATQSNPVSHYPTLFSKYSLNLSDASGAVLYETVDVAPMTKQMICHLHVHDLITLSHYEPYLANIKSTYNMLLTFTTGTLTALDPDITYLKVPNKGLDVGPKLCALHYLSANNVSYDFLLCLHSQPSASLRHKLFDPLVKDATRIQLITNILSLNKNVAGVFPNLTFDTSSKYEDNCDPFVANKQYHDELLSYIGIHDRKDDFVASNCFILHKSVIDAVFKGRLEHFYNSLNDATSFDFNWFKLFHKLPATTSLEDAYHLFKEHDLPGNNIPLADTCDALPDGMIEQTFERIWLNVIRGLGRDFLVLDSASIVSQEHIKLNTFNVPLFGGAIEGERQFVEKQLKEEITSIIKLTKHKDSVTSSHMLEPKTFIIGGVDGGGSLKFMNDFKNAFPASIQITKASVLHSIVYTANDILFVQHLLPTCDITYQMICTLYKTFKCRIIISIHDFHYFTSLEAPHSGYLSSSVVINPVIKELFSCAELVIHPSKFTYDNYAKYFPTNNFILSPHIDFVTLDSDMCIPPIKMKTIHIGHLTGFYETKGSEYVSFLEQTYKTYKDYKIQFHITGKTHKSYVENEFVTLVKTHDIHCLLALNKWGETYCYGLSKYLKTGLPILFNNIGAFKERIPEKEHYMKVFEKEVSFNKDDRALLTRKFTEMLDFIIGHTGTGTRRDGMMDVTITVSPLYNFIFNPSHYDRYMWAKIHARIKPFCVYFPQFHRLEENDLNYYPGMTDMKNLIEHIKDGNAEKLDSPDLTTLGIGSLEEYDLSNPALVTRQIDIAKAAGICGFCIYYYWFSTNTITNRNSIMERCYDNFFKEELSDFKVFFNWANEDWTKNPAFTSDSKFDISNKYSNDLILANFNNLVKYFKHPNYYKIDDCPVFYVHHPWFMTDAELASLISIFNTQAVEAGFKGIHVVVNSMSKSYETETFMFSPNYKDPHYNGEYTSLTRNKSNTLFFSFNNTARMYKPRKPHVVRITNSTPQNQKTATDAILQQYVKPSRSELHKILLINSWNEWGENMAVEPGSENKHFYLNMLKASLIRCLCM